jgi:hypothetical protein
MTSIELISLGERRTVHLHSYMEVMRMARFGWGPILESLVPSIFGERIP